MSIERTYRRDKKTTQILSLSRHLMVPSGIGQMDAWYVFKKKINSDINSQPRIISIFPALKVAATIFFIFILSYFLIEYQSVQIIVPKGSQVEKVELPDGSMVELNSESSISYGRWTWYLDREVNFEGEGYFRVQKGSLFTVVSSEAQTQVLGTSFNIYSRDGEYKVACTTGRIKVSTVESSIILNPGLYSQKRNGQLIEPQPFNEQSILSWREGKFYFESALLNTVFEEIERQFDISIIAPSTTSPRLFTGTFDKQSLADALHVVCRPMGLRYQIQDDNKVLITN